MIWRMIDSSGISSWFGLHVQGFLDVLSGLWFGLWDRFFPMASGSQQPGVPIGGTSLMVKNCTLSHFLLRFSQENA